MLLSSVGQAASYAQHSGTSAVGSGVSNTSQKAQQSHNRPLLASTNHNNYNNKFNNNSSGSSSSKSTTTATDTTSSLMKTIAVRLHRSIKDKVQRALVDSTATTKAACSTSASASTSSSSTSSSFQTEVHTTKTTTSVATQTTSPISTNQYTKSLNKDLHQKQNHYRRRRYPSKINLNLDEILPPTALHRSEEARQNANSTDSLLQELCHFKPIRPMPLTRNKLGNKPPGCDIKTPKFIKATKKANSTYKASSSSCNSNTSSSSSSSINLSNQNVHQPSVLKSAASNTTKTSQTIQRQQQCKSAFVRLKINGNDEIIKTKQQSKNHANSNDKIQKPRRRRRRNAFGVPRRCVRNKKLVDEIDDATTDSTDPMVRNIDVPQPQEKRTYQRKRKPKETNKQLIEKEVSVAATDDDGDDDELINNLQPTQSKRKRLPTKDCQAMTDALNESSSVKNISGGAKSKKISTNSNRNRKSSEITLRRSPPMTRQRARQISYNQSK